MEGHAREAGDSRKRLRSELPTAIDLLGALPDSLLLHILSFLPMEDVISTALLSRRWRHLWTSAPCLDFFCRGSRGKAWSDYLPPDFIDRALVLHEATKVRAFRAAAHPFEEEGFGHAVLVKTVDSWVRFALRRLVEDLELECWVLGNSQYELPGCVFTCESLVSLTLRWCHLDLPSRISMSALGTLTLGRVSIADYNLKDLLAGCPSLECLTLEDCHPSFFQDIRVEGSNSRLQTLKICDNKNYRVCHDYGICISAPSIKTLVLNGYLRAYHAMDESPSIVTAVLDFRPMFGWMSSVYDYYDFAFLLRDLRHVRALKLCSWCVQAMSIKMSETSWFPSDFSIISLELAIGFITSEFPGIFKALQCFTKLEFLTIDIICESKKIMDDNYEEATYVMSNVRFPPTMMLWHLKAVTIFGLVGAVCAEGENKTVEGTPEKFHDGFELIRFLLKNSPVLETLTINNIEHSRKLTKKNLEMLFGFASRLLALPRASPNAVVIIQDK